MTERKRKRKERGNSPCRVYQCPSEQRGPLAVASCGAFATKEHTCQRTNFLLFSPSNYPHRQWQMANGKWLLALFTRPPLPLEFKCTIHLHFANLLKNRIPLSTKTFPPAASFCRLTRLVRLTDLFSLLFPKNLSFLTTFFSCTSSCEENIARHW